MIKQLIEFINNNSKVNDKKKLAQHTQKEFTLTKDRSIYYNAQFAIRFSTSKSTNFSNTVLGLSALQKYDDRPVFVCLVLKDKNLLFLVNSTFLKKVSHSSQKLRVDNIKGSFNGSDIEKVFNGISNAPENFDELFEIHKQIPFEDNLVRLVEATNNISPSGTKFLVNEDNQTQILASPTRAKKFVESDKFSELKEELDSLVKKYENEILIASLIENVKIRGNVIEYLIAGKDELLKTNLINALQSDSVIPFFKSENELGDYTKDFDEEFYVATDIKTKIMVLKSNPKAYNLDKMLDFLSKQNTVFMFYFVGIGLNEVLTPVLVSMFHKTVLDNTILIKHWAGRNSRGVSQLNGAKIKDLFTEIDVKEIDNEKSKIFLNHIIDL